MTKARKRVGIKREKLARELLQRKGYKIVATNYRNRYGEVDLVARDGDTLVFVEVKTKTGDGHGSPWEMVGGWKLNQIQRMGEGYVQEYEWEGTCRIDVVGVMMDREGELAEVKHYEGVDLTTRN